MWQLMLLTMLNAMVCALAQVRESNGIGVFGFDLDAARTRQMMVGKNSIYFVTDAFQVKGGSSGKVFQLDRRTGAVEVIAKGSDLHPPLLDHCIGDTLYVSGISQLYLSDSTQFPVNGVAWWDGQRWQTLGTEFAGLFADYVVVGDTIYFAGGFTGFGGIKVNGLLKVERFRQQWSKWGDLKWKDRRDFAIWEVISDENERWIAVVGEYTGINGDSCEGIALYDRWHGRWEAVRGRWPGRVQTGAVFVGKQLWVSGWGRVETTPILVYDVEQKRWVEGMSLPGIDVGDSIDNTGLWRDRRYVYATCNVYDPVGRYKGPLLARRLLNGGGWERIPLAPGMARRGVSVIGYEMLGLVGFTSDPDSSILYAAGRFPLEVRPGAPVWQLARYDEEGGQWNGLVQLEGSPEVGVARLARVGDTLIVGGSFMTVRGGLAPNIALYDERRDEWYPLQVRTPEGLPGYWGELLAMTLYADSLLFLGGDFKDIGDLGACTMAQYNLRTGQWERLGERGPNGPVSFAFVQGDSLWVFGKFDSVDNVRVSGVAVYDIPRRQWHRFDDGGIGGIIVRRYDPSFGRFIEAWRPVGLAFWHNGRLYLYGSFWIFRPPADTVYVLLAVYDPARGWLTASEVSRGKITGTGSLQILARTSKGIVCQTLRTTIGGYGQVGQGTYVFWDGDTTIQVLFWRTSHPGLLGIDSSTSEWDFYLYDTNKRMVYKVSERNRGYQILLERVTFYPGGLMTPERLYIAKGSEPYSQGLIYLRWKLLSVEEGQKVRGGGGRLYPVPAAEEVVLEYELQHGGEAVLELVDGLGRVVERRLLGWRAAGQQRERLGLAGLASGVYHWRLRAGTEVATGVLVVVR